VLYKDRFSILGKDSTSLALCVLWIGGFTANFFLHLGKLGVLVTLLGVFTWVSLYINKSISNRADKWMHYLGKRTMYIYILNPLIINGIWQTLKKVNGGGICQLPCFALSSEL
ncbi:MAG: hypothetical protein ACI4TD_01385, partial [Phocaeicola sp.]